MCCPIKIKVGQNWYQSTGTGTYFALMLGHWPLFADPVRFLDRIRPLNWDQTGSGSAFYLVKYNSLFHYYQIRNASQLFQLPNQLIHLVINKKWTILVKNLQKWTDFFHIKKLWSARSRSGARFGRKNLDPAKSQDPDQQHRLWDILFEKVTILDFERNDLPRLEKDDIVGN